MLNTLDRYVIRNFLYSYMLWFLVLMGLRIVADLFVNMDEFTEQSLGFVGMVRFIGGYYLYQSLVYFQELGPSILTAGAAFALARMNHTNELTAVLASGVSLHRVVAPVLLVALALAGLDVVNQELLIPRVKEHLVRSRDELPGTASFQVAALNDSQRNAWYSRKFVAASQTMEHPLVIQRDERYRAVSKVTGVSATPDGDGRWVLHEASIAFPAGRDGQSTERVRTWLDPARFQQHAQRGPDGRWVCFDAEPAEPIGITAAAVDPAAGELIDPEFLIVRSAPPGGEPDLTNILARIRAAKATFGYGDGAADPGYVLTDGVLLLASDMTPSELLLRQSSQWMGFMSSGELNELLRSGKVADPQQVTVARHSRFTQPLTSLIMLLLALPFILSRERNIKASASLCLGVVGLCYVAIFACRYLGQYQPARGAAVFTTGTLAAVLLSALAAGGLTLAVLARRLPSPRGPALSASAGKLLGWSAAVLGASLAAGLIVLTAARFWSPVLAAWLPILVFGTVAVLMLEALKT